MKEICINFLNHADVADVYDDEEDAKAEVQRRLHIEAIRIERRIKELSTSNDKTDKQTC